MELNFKRNSLNKQTFHKKKTLRLQNMIMLLLPWNNFYSPGVIAISVLDKGGGVS